MQSYSQYGQDTFVLEVLKNKRGGYFVEIGSTDGIEINNTVLLEKKYNWTGICIEPNNTYYTALTSNRSCICLNTVIDDKDGTVIFNNHQSWSSITDTPSDNTEYRQAITINRVLGENNAPTNIDYLSIDCEGNELKILKTLDFKQYNVSVVTVEHNAKYYGPGYKNEIRSYLESQDFVYVKTNKNNPANLHWVDDIEDFYINKNLVHANIDKIVPNSIIFYLVNNNPIHIKRLYDSLDCLQKNFLDEYPYPVVFGHEGISQAIIDTIKQKLNVKTYFYKIDFKVPDYSQEILKQIPERLKGHWDENAFFSMGYRHMCRFFSGEIYKDPFFEKVKFLLRLDCDSYFTKKVTYDIFKRMEDTGSVYGTVGEDTDMDYVVEGFGDACMSYFKENYNFSKPVTMFQTHFDLTDVQWVRNSDYMDFYDFIDSTGNIYIKRWGDAVIKFQGMTHTAGSRIYRFSDIPYKHGGDL
jgi:FkbM family methyltransferase